MIKKNVVGLAIASLIACCTIVNAQGWEDSSGGVATNPNSGIALNPTFSYDPMDGKIYIDNAVDGVVDSADNSTLLGNDAGLISFLVSYDGAAADVGATLGVFDEGIAWAAPTVFNGKIQLSGNAIAASFLPVREEPTAIVQLPTGLGLSNFMNADGKVEVETGQNHTFGSPGVTLFDNDAAASGNFTVIPEPSSLALLGIAMLGGLGLRRRQ